ncbi:hypothetical protein ACFL1B_05235 [Nanoarchaeota archaeon]
MVLMPRARDKISFFVGVILLGVGIVPLLNTMGFISFDWPGSIAGFVASIAVWIIAVAGAYLFMDGIIEPKTHSMHWILIMVGLVLLIVGLIPILNSFGYIQFSLGFLDNLVVYNSIISVEGLLLVIAGFGMH